MRMLRNCVERSPNNQLTKRSYGLVGIYSHTGLSNTSLSENLFYPALNLL